MESPWNLLEPFMESPWNLLDPFVCLELCAHKTSHGTLANMWSKQTLTIRNRLVSNHINNSLQRESDICSIQRRLFSLTNIGRPISHWQKVFSLTKSSKFYHINKFFKTNLIYKSLQRNFTLSNSNFSKDKSHLQKSSKIFHI